MNSTDKVIEKIIALIEDGKFEVTSMYTVRNDDYTVSCTPLFDSVDVFVSKSDQIYNVAIYEGDPACSDGIPMYFYTTLNSKLFELIQSLYFTYRSSEMVRTKAPPETAESIIQKLEESCDYSIDTTFEEVVKVIANRVKDEQVSELEIYNSGYRFKYSSEHTKETHTVWVGFNCLMVIGNDPLMLYGDTDPIHAALGGKVTSIMEMVQGKSEREQLEVAGEIFLGKYSEIVSNDGTEYRLENPDVNDMDEDEMREAEHVECFQKACEQIYAIIADNRNSLNISKAIGSGYCIAQRLENDNVELYIDVREDSIELTRYTGDSGFATNAKMYGDAVALCQALQDIYVGREVMRKLKYNTKDMEVFKQILELK